jgi:large subunit ribosomal protein L15
MDLSTLAAGVNIRKAKKRVGRGPGSGHGKTASRGHKGQYASAGANLPGAIFSGGQTPIHRRLPKRGFTNGTFRKDFAIVNVGDLDDRFDAGATVDATALKQTRLVVGSFDGIRILGYGELTKKLTVVAHHFTKSAKAKIEAKGGACQVVPGRKPPVRNKMKPKPAKAG